MVAVWHGFPAGGAAPGRVITHDGLLMRHTGAVVEAISGPYPRFAASFIASRYSACSAHRAANRPGDSGGQPCSWLGSTTWLAGGGGGIVTLFHWVKSSCPVLPGGAITRSG